MSLIDHGFDPDKILVKAPKKIPESTLKSLPDPEVEKKFNLCEFHLCLKKAQGHFGSINLCWDHGKHLEETFSSWKKEWRFIYWKTLDSRLNRQLQ